MILYTPSQAVYEYNTVLFKAANSPLRPPSFVSFSYPVSIRSTSSSIQAGQFRKHSPAIESKRQKSTRKNALSGASSHSWYLSVYLQNYIQRINHPSSPIPLWLCPRPISNSQLHALPHFHLCPIYLVVFKGSY